MLVINIWSNIITNIPVPPLLPWPPCGKTVSGSYWTNHLLSPWDPGIHPRFSWPFNRWTGFNRRENLSPTLNPQLCCSINQSTTGVREKPREPTSTDWHPLIEFVLFIYHKYIMSQLGFLRSIFRTYHTHKIPLVMYFFGDVSIT